ncbi:MULTISPECIES: nucleic acid-binding protein [unclassified Moorena]|uniref:nucleic acid-binding protein n=1 Tax=unclassified Moorena TaxID=2683338 RepID=UPI0013B9A72C|nr:MULTISPECIES: nucleic acid-binding protein [unclassified Moorena]NEP30895.1 type II toxin-antitoxin system VapC family toxin [Moorena sp. SIO3B2]NEP48387.1 type II toxin-antitoxin system VapC family toxin [Moorena sp. SIO3C2]NER88856.1 type II toxin-antitoxin system VapC family toxin [Moorena sp. SIO3A2]NES43648.1 type II toxin-antitoxin system VapC family toxin [Moorena sp. SIO2C4]
MSKVIVLDSAPVGLITNPKGAALSLKCQEWFYNLFDRGYDVVLPEIIDYEIRRELLRANKVSGIKKLNRLKAEIIYLPITTEVMLKAAELWAEVRKKGKPTADPKALDGDVILAAQAILVTNSGYDVTVATNNTKHLSLFVNAREWQEI